MTDLAALAVSSGNHLGHKLEIVAGVKVEQVFVFKFAFRGAEKLGGHFVAVDDISAHVHSVINIRRTVVQGAELLLAFFHLLCALSDARFQVFLGDLKFRDQFFILQGDFAAFQAVFHHNGKLGELNRFEQEIKSAQRDSIQGEFDSGVAADDHWNRVRGNFLHQFDQFDSVHIRQFEIDKNEIVDMSLEFLTGSRPGWSGIHSIAPL